MNSQLNIGWMKNDWINIKFDSFNCYLNH